MGHVVHTEQLLKAHAGDPGHGVQTGEGQSGNAHGHEHGGRVHRHAEHLKETGNTAAEDLEGGACGRSTVRSSGSTGHAQSQNSQQAFQNHGAVADLQHILLVFNSLGGGTGGHQTVESGHRAAGHGDEQNGEHGSQLFIGKAGEHGQVHRGMRHQQTHHSPGDHADEHECGHVVAGLLQKPHGQHGGKEDIDKGDIAPGGLAEDQGAVHAHGEGGEDAHDAQHGFLPAGEVPLLLDQAHHHGEHHEHDGHHTGRAVGLCGVGELRCAVHHSVGVEGACHHVGKGCDDNEAEQPAEQQEQLPAQLADVLFNQHTHGFAFVFHGGIQRAEVGDGAEEHAADQHPQQHRQPAEGCGLNRAGNGACTGNGGKLMAENGPAVGGNEVLAVIEFHGRGLRLGVDAPFVGQPAAIEGVGCDQHHSRHQYDH